MLRSCLRVGAAPRLPPLRAFRCQRSPTIDFPIGTFLSVQSMRNPFQYGAEFKSGQIVNRKLELRDVERAMITAAAQLLKSAVAKTGERILRFFARLRPSISYSPDTNTWSGSIDAGAVPIPIARRC